MIKKGGIMKLSNFPTNSGIMNQIIVELVEKAKIKDIDIDREYLLIQEKKSKLSSNQRKIINNIKNYCDSAYLLDDVELFAKEITKESNIKDISIMSEIVSLAKTLEIVDDSKYDKLKNELFECFINHKDVKNK